jgi:hypothetical protein
MLLPENKTHQTNLFGTDLLQLLDERDPLRNWQTLLWSEFE